MPSFLRCYSTRQNFRSNCSPDCGSRQEQPAQQYALPPGVVVATRNGEVGPEEPLLLRRIVFPVGPFWCSFARSLSLSQQQNSQLTLPAPISGSFSPRMGRPTTHKIHSSLRCCHSFPPEPKTTKTKRETFPLLLLLLPLARRELLGRFSL